MAEGGQEDLSVLKRKIVLVDKLVRKQQKNDARNDELTAKLQKKEQVLDSVHLSNLRTPTHAQLNICSDT